MPRVSINRPENCWSNRTSCEISRSYRIALQRASIILHPDQTIPTRWSTNSVTKWIFAGARARTDARRCSFAVDRPNIYVDSVEWTSEQAPRARKIDRLFATFGGAKTRANFLPFRIVCCGFVTCTRGRDSSSNCPSGVRTSSSF